MKKLENIITELGIIGQDKKVNSKYNSKVLTSMNEYIGKLEKINLKTREGLDSYRELTGFQTKDVSPEKTESNHGIAHAGVINIFEKYITTHIKPITEELGDMIQLNIGYSSCPETESKSKKYNAARNIVHTNKDIIKKIKENPEEYINKRISNAPDFMKALIAKYSGEVCQIDAQDAQRKASRVIHEYGSAKFVTETHEHLEALKTAYITDIETLDKREMKIKKENPYLDTDESVKCLAEIETARAEIEKRKEQFKMLPELTNIITQNAIKIIQEREKETKKGKVIKFPVQEEPMEEKYLKAA